MLPQSLLSLIAAVGLLAPGVLALPQPEDYVESVHPATAAAPATAAEDHGDRESNRRYCFWGAIQCYYTHDRCAVIPPQAANGMCQCPWTHGHDDNKLVKMDCIWSVTASYRNQCD